MWLDYYPQITGWSLIYTTLFYLRIYNSLTNYESHQFFEDIAFHRLNENICWARIQLYTPDALKNANQLDLKQPASGTNKWATLAEFLVREWSIVLW